MNLRLVDYRGPALAPYLDALGSLRIAVFREYPYLYEGGLDYERQYLRVYLESPRSQVTLAFHGDEVVGATTCVPLADEGPEFQEPFLAAGIAVDSVCYFGESILLPAYRGQGAGKAFFQRREAHAAALPGITLAAFCAVDRPEDHPLRPPGHRPLDGFWSRLGYRKRPGMRCEFRWKEIGEAEESPKTLTFWTKAI